MQTPKRAELDAELSDGLKKGSVYALIQANRAKRLAIAEAMKAEAGVVGHEVDNENLAGLAFIGTGRIKSPAGKNMRELYIVAHECGHIHLHNEGEGYSLPMHVKEFEAESYAHQAFKEHGMTMPRLLSEWGRSYVASWIEKDRAEGVIIDPRAVAYASGERSPYEPLRFVPETWKLHAGLGRRPERVSVLPAVAAGRRPGLFQELGDWAKYSGLSFMYSCWAVYFTLKTFASWQETTGLFDKDGMPTAATGAAVVLGAVWLTNLLAMWRAHRMSFPHRS